MWNIVIELHRSLIYIYICKTNCLKRKNFITFLNKWQQSCRNGLGANKCIAWTFFWLYVSLSVYVCVFGCAWWPHIYTQSHARDWMWKYVCAFYSQNLGHKNDSKETYKTDNDFRDKERHSKMTSILLYKMYSGFGRKRTNISSLNEQLNAC